MDSKTRSPLIIAFAVVQLFIVILTLAGAYLLLSGIQTIEDVVAQNTRKTDLISDMRVAARFRALTLSQMQLIDDPFDREEEYDRFNVFGTEYIVARNKLDKLIDDKEERDIFNDANALAIKIGKSQIQIVNYIQDERFAEAKQLQIKSSIPLQRQTDDMFDRMQNLQRERTAKAVSASVEGFRGSLYALLSMALFVFIAVIFIGRFVVQRTINSEREIQSRRIELEEKVQQRTRELVIAKEQAEQASQTKTDFLSQMSHELRTPLNAILGFSQILQFNRDNTLTNEQIKNAAEIQNAGVHLLELINELLDLAQIESGNLELHIDRVSLSEVMNETVKMLEPLAEKGQIKIINSVKGDELDVMVDKLRLKQILLNIIANAIKYNYENGLVYINAQMSGDFIKVFIKDTGQGLSEENKEKVFNNFERLSSHGGIEGSGIGLSVTRHLVDLMGGNIGVETTTDNGCTFWIELPIK